MKSFASPIFLLLVIFTTAISATTIQAAPEPMSFEEKLALVEGGGAHRLLRGLQTGLTYKGQICRAETKGVMPCRTAFTECLSSQWDYWKMNLQAGVAYTIEVDRVTCGLDPTLTLYEGIGATVPDGCFYDGVSTDELTFITAADDNDPEPAFCSGVRSPASDPKVVVTPSTSGPFTLAVANFASDSFSCKASAGYQYKIKISPSPSCA